MQHYFCVYIQVVSVRRMSAHFAGALKKSRGAIMKSLVREYSDAAAEASEVRKIASIKKEAKWHSSSSSSLVSRQQSYSTIGSWSNGMNVSTTTTRPVTEATPTSATSSTEPFEKPKSNDVEPDDEAFWALEWVRAELKKRVTRAKENLVKVQKRSQSWTRDGYDGLISRAFVI